MSSRTAFLTALAALATACAHGGACPAGATCGDARWLDGMVVVDGRQVLAQATVVAVPGRAPDLARGDALPVSTRGACVRFDLAELAGAAGVERAVLALAPHPSWRPLPSGARLLVRPVAAPWTADGVAAGEMPAVGGEAAGVRLPSVRGPVRVDVTEAVRAWLAGVSAAEGLALETDGGEAVFVGPRAAESGQRPRLEVVLR